MLKNFYLSAFILFVFAANAQQPESDHSVPHTPTIIVDGEPYALAKQQQNRFGTVGFYRSESKRKSLSLRITAEGTSLLNTSNDDGSYFMLAKHGKLEKFIPDLSQSTNVTTPQAKVGILPLIEEQVPHFSLVAEIPNLNSTEQLQSTAINQFLVSDNTVELTFIIDFLAHREMFVRQIDWGISPQLQIQASIDKANLILFNSGITEFTFSLGDIVYRQQWQSAAEFQAYQQSSASDNGIIVPLALSQNVAERIVMVSPSSLFNSFLGSADQWQFGSFDEQNGALFTQHSQRIVTVSASLLPTFILARELGRTMGLSSERASSTEVDNATPYGYTSPSGYLSTMSEGVECSPNCVARVDVFSSPNFVYLGEPMGIDAANTNAADATSWLKNTWPQTTYTTPQVQALEQSNNGVNNSVSWSIPTGTTSQVVYVGEQECPARASHLSFSGGSLQLLTGYTSTILDNTTNSFSLSSTDTGYCVIVVGRFNYASTNLSRPIAMGHTNVADAGLTISSLTTEISLNNLGDSVSIDLTTSDVNILNSNIELRVKQRENEASRGVDGFEKISDSSFNGLLDIAVSGSGSVRTVDVSLTTQLADIQTVLSAQDYGYIERAQLPIQLAINEATHNVLINLSGLFDSLPKITLDQELVSFLNSERELVKTLTATVSNIDSADQIEVVSFTQDAGSTWDLSSVSILDLGNNEFQVSISAPAPTDADQQYAAVIRVDDFDLNVHANFMLENWASVTFDEEQVAAIIGQPVRIFGQISNLPQNYSLIDIFALTFVASGGDLDFSGDSYSPSNLAPHTANFGRNFTFNTLGQFSLSARSSLAVTTLGQSLPIIVLSTDGDEDNDGVENQNDDFPLDPLETLDTDSDGIGNNADLDDDGDGMSDLFEIAYGLNSLDNSDAGNDIDSDGFSNLEEFLAGTDPLDSDSDDDGILDSSDEFPLDSNAGIKLFLDVDDNSIQDLSRTTQAGGVNLVDSFSGVVVQERQIASDFTVESSLIVPDMNGNAIWDQVVSGTTNSGESIWYIYDGSDGNAIYTHAYPGWLQPARQIDFVVLEDINQNLRSEMAILVETVEGQSAYLLYDLGTQNLLKAVLYPEWFEGISLNVLSDWSGNNSQELATFGKTSADLVAFMRFDALSGANLNVLTVPGWFIPATSKSSDDLNNNGVTELLVLGETLAGANAWLAFDGQTGLRVRTFGYPGWLTPKDISLITDASGDQVSDVITLGQTTAGFWLWRRNDVLTNGIQTQSGLPGWLTPAEVDTIVDVNGNGGADVIVKGTSPNSTKVWLIYDGLNGSLLKQVVPPQ